MQLKIFLCALLSSVSLAISGIRNTMQMTYHPDFSETSIFHDYATGSLGFYMLPHEMHNLMTMLVAEFPEVVHSKPIGQTYLNETMHAFFLGTGFSEGNWEEEAKARPSILINGMHHAREFQSQMQCVYTMLRILFDFVKEDQ